MTLRLVPGPAPDGRGAGDPADRLARSGQPWTDEDYESLLAACRQGLTLDAIATTLRRRDTAVLDRARRILPVTERGLPRDRAVARLRQILQDDPDYDWATALLRSPPPRPIEHAVYERHGLEGLRTEELLDVGQLVVLQQTGPLRIHESVLRLLERRGLVEELERRVGSHLAGRARDRVADSYDRGYPDPWESPVAPEWDRPFCDCAGCEPPVPDDPCHPPVRDLSADGDVLTDR